ATFLLRVDNTGNQDDAYTATILGTDGPITAHLVDLDGRPTQTVSRFRLPGLSSGVLQVQADLGATGQGQVTVRVTSLSDATRTATVTAPVSTCVPDPAAPPNVRWLEQVYCDLFGRELDASGRSFWPGLVNRGVDRTEVVVRLQTDAPT